MRSKTRFAGFSVRFRGTDKSGVNKYLAGWMARLCCLACFHVVTHCRRNTIPKSVKHELTRVIQLCSEIPSWRVLDDRIVKFDSIDTDWASASALYLFTHAFRESSPVCRADDGTAVPLYKLPVDQRSREDLHWWMAVYRELDRIWLDSGHLEIPARQLVDPNSQFSRRGRKLADAVEEATGLQTYYYLMRYWGRKRGEATRRCPGCGAKWAVTATPDGKGLSKHEFRCEPCRLISSLADDYSEPSRTLIGEWRSRGTKSTGAAATTRNRGKGPKTSHH